MKENLLEEIRHELISISGLCAYNDENNELKLELRRLYNYFMDYLEDEMSPNSFSEMWDFVRKDKQWENKVRW